VEGVNSNCRYDGFLHCGDEIRDYPTRYKCNRNTGTWDLYEVCGEGDYEPCQVGCENGTCGYASAC
jgi:hypothetical protein